MILAKHRYHKEAADCFQLAKMPLELGRSARETNDFERAASAFLAAEAFVDAAECFMEIGRHKDALEIFIRIKDHERAIEVIHELLEASVNMSYLKMNDAEIKLMMNHIIGGSRDSKFIDALIQYGKLIDLMIELIDRKNLKAASEVYLRSTSDIGPELLARNDLGSVREAALAEVFLIGGASHYAGQLFERIGQFAEAGQAYHKAEDFERAAYSYERCGDKAKALEMRLLLAEKGRPKSFIQAPIVPEQGAPLFAMGDSTTGLDSKKLSAIAHEERTQTYTQLESLTPIPNDLSFFEAFNSPEKLLWEAIRVHKELKPMDSINSKESGAYIILSGVLKENTPQEGEGLGSFNVLGDGEAFEWGETLGLYEPKGQLIAQAPTVLIYFPLAQLRNLCSKHPELKAKFGASADHAA